MGNCCLVALDIIFIMIDLYSDKILFYAGNIPYTKPLENPDYHSVKHNRLCGSRVEIAYNLSDDKITAYSHVLETCALGQASASILAHHIMDKSMSEIISLHNSVFAMLKNNDAAPIGVWKDFSLLQSVRDFPARHASILLVFEAICEAYKSKESKCVSTCSV